MKAYEATASIAASPDTIWAIITDGPKIADRDSGVIRIDGRIALGEKIKVTSSANPKRAFAVTVTEFEPDKRMVWSGGMPLGLFKGVRTYTLTASGDGTTGFAMREEYTGLLLPMIWKTIPDLGRSFRQYANGSRQLAERAR